MDVGGHRASTRTRALVVVSFEPRRTFATAVSRSEPLRRIAARVAALQGQPDRARRAGRHGAARGGHDAPALAEHDAGAARRRAGRAGQAERDPSAAAHAHAPRAEPQAPDGRARPRRAAARAGAARRGVRDVAGQVAAVVGRPHQRGDGPGRRGRPGVRPRLAPGGGMPRRAAVDGDLDGAHPTAAAVRGGAGDRRRLAGGHRDRRRPGQGRRRGRAVRRRARGLEVDGERGGLHAHVGELVDRRLLHRLAHGRLVAVVELVEAPGPLHGARAEDEGVAGRPVRVAVQRQVVGGGAVLVGRPVVRQDLAAACVVDMRTSPAGRAPLSSSASHS